MRLVVIGLIALVVVGYGGATTYLKVQEPSLVYKPGARNVDEPSAQFALAQHSVTFPSGDGTRLNAWIVPAAKTDSSGYWLLINHGNYGNIGYGERPEFYSYARDIGLNLFAFDYRGFGTSEGTPREQGVYADAEAAYRYLTDSLHVPPDRIVIFGHSLGSGVATELATRVPAAALVIEGAYTSVPDRGQELYPWLPVRLIASERFETISKIARVKVPKLLLHSPDDSIIPYAHGERLFAVAAHPKRFVPIKGGHIVAFRDDRAVYFGAIRSLVDSLKTVAMPMPYSEVR
ncbi:MAG: alpha/beta hydrolase [Gemmatimonadaceae bacterium]